MKMDDLGVCPFLETSTWLKIVRRYQATTVIRSSKGPFAEHLQCCDTMVRFPSCADVGWFFAAFKEGDPGCLQRWLAALMCEDMYSMLLYPSFPSVPNWNQISCRCIGQWLLLTEGPEASFIAGEAGTVCSAATFPCYDVVPTRCWVSKNNKLLLNSSAAVEQARGRRRSPAPLNRIDDIFQVASSWFTDSTGLLMISSDIFLRHSITFLLEPQICCLLRSWIQQQAASLLSPDICPETMGAVLANSGKYSFWFRFPSKVIWLNIICGYWTIGVF